MPAALSAAATQAVLVLDADLPSALSIVRALGLHGLTVSVAASGPHPLASYSRHATERLTYPDPLLHETGFIDWLGQRAAENRFGLIIPVTERTVVPIWRHRHLLDDRRIAVAPSAALEQALDKALTLKLAESLGIPVPLSLTIESLDQLPAAAARIGFPTVVKPARSMGRDGSEQLQLSVSYAHNLTQLETQVRHALRYGGVILQEYFRGDGVGIELIADQGTVRHAFQHRRLHEVPLTGGGSSLRVSEDPVPALRAAAEQLMRATGWHGVAMVEFKYASASGDFRLMEINGRFWGSLPLAVAAGANFPVMLHQLMTTGSVGEHPPAKAGVLCRQLARDVDWLEYVLRRAAPAQLVRLPSLREVLRDSLLVFSPRHHFDVQSLRDPKPGWVDLCRLGQRQWQRVRGLLQQRRRLNHERRAGIAGGSGHRALQRAGSVLFLCHGNINRSALAHAYAAQRYGDRIAMTSAGFHAPGGRPADPVMVDVASAHGVDLTAWQSCSLTSALVGEADVIFAMEIAHLERLASQHPGARSKAFLLGAASAPGRPAVEVPDPYGQPRGTYERVCQQVITSVDAWFAALPMSATEAESP
jgi:protein-tyrosine-phosphatase/predicted ATP-grasp superfamily ATP-dependent carboligase